MRRKEHVAAIRLAVIDLLKHVEKTYHFAFHVIFQRIYGYPPAVGELFNVALLNSFQSFRTAREQQLDLCVDDLGFSSAVHFEKTVNSQDVAKCIARVPEEFLKSFYELFFDPLELDVLV